MQLFLEKTETLTQVLLWDAPDSAPDKFGKVAGTKNRKARGLLITNFKPVKRPLN